MTMRSEILLVGWESSDKDFGKMDIFGEPVKYSWFVTLDGLPVLPKIGETVSFTNGCRLEQYKIFDIIHRLNYKHGLDIFDENYTIYLIASVQILRVEQNEIE